MSFSHSYKENRERQKRVSLYKYIKTLNRETGPALLAARFLLQWGRPSPGERGSQRPGELTSYRQRGGHFLKAAGTSRKQQTKRGGPGPIRERGEEKPDGLETDPNRQPGAHFLEAKAERQQDRTERPRRPTFKEDREPPAQPIREPKARKGPRRQQEPTS